MDDEPQDNTEAGHPGAALVGKVRRYKVTDAAGRERHQVILVTGLGDEGTVRGVPLGYEHEAARFRPDDLDG